MNWPSLLVVLGVALGTAPMIRGQDLVITEFMAVNATVLADEDGDYSDWIEIYNPSEVPVDLEGWWLTDKAGNLWKWRFPSIVLQAHSYLVVFASDKKRTQPGGPLHTNFKLDADGEFLALVRRDGTVAWQYAPRYPAQRPDTSYGLEMLVDPLQGVPRYFDHPTPGRANDEGETRVVPSVSFSQYGGVYAGAITVELWCDVPQAAIYYTVDGSEPSAESLLYTSPIVLTNSAMITARGYATGYQPGNGVAQTYTLLDAEAAQFRSEVPLVILETYGEVIRRDMEPRATAGLTVIAVPEGAESVSLLDPAEYHGRAGVEGRGQTSWGFPKKPLNVELRFDDDQQRRAPLLGMPAGSDWILLNPYSDKTFLNDFLALELHERMGHYAVRRRFVEVFLNGRWEGGAPDPSGRVGLNDHVGLYLLVERVEINGDRVNIAPLELKHETEPEITGGYIWKKDSNDWGDRNFALPYQPINAGDALKFYDPPGDRLSPLQCDWLIQYLTEFEAVVYGPDWRDPASGYPGYVEVRSLVDYHWIVEFTKQIEGYRLSNYMQKDREGKIRMEPIWDWKQSFGNANYLEGGRTNGWYYPLISEQQHIWLRRLIAAPGDPDFRQAIADRWGDLRQGVLNASRILGRVTEITNRIYEAALRDHARWPRLSSYVWPNPDGPPWDVNYATPGSYLNLIHQFKQWITGRFQWIDRQFLEAPSWYGQPPTLVLTQPGNEVLYYTTDGSDPRLPGGGLSPRAYRYSGPIPLPPDARVIARAWSADTNHWTAWSPPCRAVFGNPLPALAISELMYHPVSGGDYEYIEITNLSSTNCNLAGVRLAGGIDFTFPPGPWQLAGADTVANFDEAGTPYAGSQLAAGPGPTVSAGGGDGSFLRLAARNSSANRNRIAFDQTAAGEYDRITAEFDFRATNAGPAPVMAPPAVQDFDTQGTGFVLHSYDSSEPATPNIAGADDESTGQFIRLTRETGSEVGGLFFDATEPGGYPYVVIDFDFRMTATGTPADGMGLVFLNTSNHGVTGATAASWSEEPNMPGSIGVGFDNYRNAQSANEPDANHVSLHWNGAPIAGAAASPAFSLAAGVFHHAQVIICFENARALVTVKLTPDIHGQAGPAETLFSNFVVDGATAYRGRLAFCARTGGAWASHDIDNVQARYLSAPLEEPAGLSLVLLPCARYGGTGAGTGTNDYLDAPNLGGAFGLDLALHSSELINDVTLHWDGEARGSAFVAPSSCDLDNGFWHRARLDFGRRDEGFRVWFSLTPDILSASNARPVTVFSDCVVPGFFPVDMRVEVAGRSGGMEVDLDVDNLRVRYARSAPNLLGPGERILVVASMAAHQALYGSNQPIAGEYTGRLSNAGERLQLVDAYGQAMLDFTYSDDWYPLTDGSGFPLVVTNFQLGSASWNDPASWAVGVAGGTPGEPDPPPPTVIPVHISEVLVHAPDITGSAVELHNPSGEPADVSDWSISSDFDWPQFYRLPEGSIIPPGGYFVVQGEFGLPPAGGEVWLFAADANRILTGYYDGFAFGPAKPGVSFGRYVTSTGAKEVMPEAARTLGTTNAGPWIGPVVISEIFYNGPGDASADAEEEFIELHKISGSAAALQDPANPTACWRLRSGVDFDLPADTVLSSGGFLVVVSFDPVNEPLRLQAFRSRYALSAEVIVLGPYRGRLSNSGEAVELTKPVSEVEVLVDRVEYADAAPWPAIADGGGFSLQRSPAWACGNDPAHWIALPPTPGGAPPGGPPPAAAVVINEVLPNAAPPWEDAIEVYNPAPTNIDVGGWFLTDNLARPKRFRLPAGMVIPAGGFLAFDEHLFNPRINPLPGSFVLGAQGEEIYLFSADADGNLTGYHHGFRFGPAELNVSFGRHLTSLGEEHIVAQKQLSFFQANAGPRVGPVVISEIMYAPPGAELSVDGHEDVGGEYVELENISPEPVTMGAANGSWAMAGAVQLCFPGGLVLPPGGRVLVVSFDPESNPGGLAAFRARYGWMDAAHLVGPFQGQLADAGETLELRKPFPGAASENSDDSLSILVERVRYSAGAPWPPAAAGWGLSLHRKVLDAYADDPANWEARAPTPPRCLPCLLLAPTNQWVIPGATATFRAGAVGGSPVHYQWLRNGVPLAGATNAMLAITNAQSEDEGKYAVTVTDAFGSTASSGAQLTVLSRPVVARQLESQVVAVGSAVSLSLETTGLEPLWYIWRRNGATFLWPGPASLVISKVGLADAGIYQVIITNLTTAMLGGYTRSANGYLSVVDLPAEHVVTAGQDARLQAIAGLPPQFLSSFEWQRNGATLTAGTIQSTPLQTRFTNELTLQAVTPEQAGEYTFVLTNDFGAAGAFTTTLQVMPADTDGDGLPDHWETANGLDPFDPADAAGDLDEDGLTNLDEFRAGTDPREGTSSLRVEAAMTLSGRVRLRFHVIANRRYTVESSRNLDPANWQPLFDLHPAASGPVNHFLAPLPGATSFYRVVVVAK